MYVVNRKRVLYILSGITLLFIAVVIIYFSTFVQPKIFFTAEVVGINNEDYKRILNNAQVMYPNKDIDKFKHINIGIKVTEPVGINNHVKIERDILHQYLKSNEKVQILGGGSFENGNEKEYAENIEIYLINISEDELKNTLKNFRYKVTWNDFNGNPNSKIFYLKDYLK